MKSPKPNLQRRTTARLLSDWAEIMSELRRRGAVRSGNSPTGDLAEALVAEFFTVELEPNATKGFDLKTRAGKRVQVKARRRTERSKPSHYGLIRNLDSDPFDLLVVVHFDEQFGVDAAFQLPINVARELAKYSAHTNGWRLPLIRPERGTVKGVTAIELG